MTIVPSFGLVSSPDELFQIIASEAMPNGNISIRGVARMADVDHTAIVRGGDFKVKKLAESLGAQGFTCGDLLNDGFSPVAVIIVLEYFAYESKAKAPGAKMLMRTFGAFGLKEVLTKLQQPVKEPAPQPAPRQLPQRDAIDYLEAAKALPTLQVNAQFKALLEDALTDDLELMRNQKLLGGGIKTEYTIVKVRARELGYSLEEIKNGSALGRYVKQFIEPAFVKRIGDFSVNHYEITPQLDEVIHSFFR